MLTKCSSLSLLVSILFFIARPVDAITFGQVDNFQGGSLMNWVNGASSLSLINTGGPAGVGDAYMQLSANGAGSGGKLVAQNYTFPPSFNSQWTGDYLAAGVNGIELDLLNQTAVTLSIRIAFKSNVRQDSSGYLSLPVILAPGSGWQHFSISFTASNLTAIGGPAAYSTFFRDGFAEMRIINEAGAVNLNGDPVVGMLGVDNIRAVPEPATIALLLIAGLAAGGQIVRRRRGARA